MSLQTWVTTADRFEGYRVTRHLGIVRGIAVRSLSPGGAFSAGLQSWAGGSVAKYVELSEQARTEAYGMLVEHAASLGANAVIAMRYESNEVAQGITEVLAYGTAVIIEASPA